jgi:hypothetical protein
VVAGDDVGGNVVFDKRFNTALPGFIEFDGLDALQNVDAEWRKSDLKDRARFVPKAGWAQSGKWCAILGQGPEYGLTVLLARPYQNVEVFVARGSECTPTA